MVTAHRLNDDDDRACATHFGGDVASRAEARTINAGVPEGDGASPAGLAGGGTRSESHLRRRPADARPDEDRGGRRDPG